MVNTEGRGRGSSEAQAPGSERRSPRQAHCQGYNTEGKEPRALLQRAVLTSMAEARAGVYRPINSLNTSLCSGRGTPAGCSFHPY